MNLGRNRITQLRTIKYLLEKIPTLKYRLDLRIDSIKKLKLSDWEIPHAEA